MQINSVINVNQQYFNALENKHKENVSEGFKEELKGENSSEEVKSTTSTKSVDEQQPQRYHEVFTYANTKGMTDDDIDVYFSERSEEERGQIKGIVRMANNFSENDAANEAVFNEFKKYPDDLGAGSMKGINFILEKENYLLGHPTLANVLVVSDEYLAAIKSGLENPAAQGIFMNAAHKARYESGDNNISFNTKFTEEQADDFLATMTQLAKDKMDEARGTAVFGDYKEAYERYKRMNDNYNSLLAQNEENAKVDISS